jgi:hypothetical protein
VRLSGVSPKKALQVLLMTAAPASSLKPFGIKINPLVLKSELDTHSATIVKTINFEASMGSCRPAMHNLACPYSPSSIPHGAGEQPGLIPRAAVSLWALFDLLFGGNEYEVRSDNSSSKMKSFSNCTSHKSGVVCMMDAMGKLKGRWSESHR